MSYKFVDIHSHRNRIDSNIITIYNLKPNENPNSEYFSIGIHPWNINNNPDYSLEQLEDFLKNNQLSFIGECGLDKLKCNDFELQLKYFILQLELAKTYKLPVILHCVKAFEEVLKAISDKKNVPAFIFHGFHKSPELSLDLTSKGYYISLGKALFSSPEKVKSILEKVNHSKLFLETDDAEFLIEEAYERLAHLSGLPLEYWKEKLFENFKTITQ